VATLSRYLFYATLIALPQLLSETSVESIETARGSRHDRGAVGVDANPTGGVRFCVRGVAKATNSKHTAPFPSNRIRHPSLSNVLSTFKTIKVARKVTVSRPLCESRSSGEVMVGNPLVQNGDGHDYRVLRMPKHRQPSNAPECVCYSLWMAIHYVANEYPSKDVRDKTTPPKLDTIQEYIDVGKRGWENPTQDPLTELASETGSLKLNLEARYGGHPQGIDEFAKKGMDKLLPTIAWIDQLLLKNGERDEGPLHAVVIQGIGDSHITIADPLVEGTTTLEIDKVDEAWDPEFNTAIEVMLRDGLEPTRRCDV